ncbi:MAG: hypothetical protein ABI591_07775 [Kofleriaceae bacterium]
MSKARQWLALAAADAKAAREQLESCVDVLALFPEFLTTPGGDVLWEHLSLRGAELDDAAMRELGALFVELWQRKPRNVYWYGDLRQSFVPYNLQSRIAAVPEVAAQLLEDFRSLAAVERARPTDLGCRRLDRAAELLLHAPPEACRTTMLPIVRLDYVDREHVTRMSPHYEAVYWGMLKILRKLGEDL